MTELADQYRARGMDVVLTYPVVDGRCMCGDPKCLRPGRHVVDGKPEGNEGLAARLSERTTTLSVRGAEGARNVASWIEAVRGASTSDLATLSSQAGPDRIYWFIGQAVPRLDPVLGVRIESEGAIVPLPDGRGGRWFQGERKPVPTWLGRAGLQDLRVRHRVRKVIFGNHGGRPLPVTFETVPRHLTEVETLVGGPQSAEMWRAMGAHIFDLTDGHQEGYTAWTMWCTKVGREPDPAVWREWHLEKASHELDRDKLHSLYQEDDRSEMADVEDRPGGVRVITPVGDVRATPMENGRWEIRSVRPIPWSGPVRAIVRGVWDTKRQWWREFQLLHFLYGTIPGHSRRELKSNSQKGERLRRALGEAIQQRLQAPVTLDDINQNIADAERVLGELQSIRLRMEEA